jgi:hypothetical protein
MDESRLSTFLAARRDCSSLRAPAITILPELNIKAVVFGSRIRTMHAAKRLGLYSAFLALCAMDARSRAQPRLTVDTTFCSCGTMPEWCLNGSACQALQCLDNMASSDNDVGYSAWVYHDHRSRTSGLSNATEDQSARNEERRSSMIKEACWIGGCVKSPLSQRVRGGGARAGASVGAIDASPAGSGTAATVSSMMIHSASAK